MKVHALTALVLVLLLTVPAAMAQQSLSQAKNPVVWKVNGEPLYAAELSMTMQSIVGQARVTGVPAPEGEELMEAATENLIEQRLLAQEARRQAIRNNEERLAEMKARMIEQGGGEERLRNTLTSAGSSLEQALGLLAERDLVVQFIDTRIAPSITVSDEEIRAYYDDNPDLFEAGEQVHARHIIIEVGEDAHEALVNAARERAKAAHKRVLAGEDFAELAKELSDGPSAPAGGDLGTFDPARMVPPFAEALATLEEGEISGLVRTPFGFHIIKMEEIIPTGKKSFDEVREKIGQVLRAQRIGETVSGLLETLRANGKIEPVMPV